jgi:hypothetical protein
VQLLLQSKRSQLETPFSKDLEMESSPVKISLPPRLPRIRKDDSFNELIQKLAKSVVVPTKSTTLTHSRPDILPIL